ncbi:MAG: solute carrier family 23 protein [Lachnospiraceae bacterium]
MASIFTAIGGATSNSYLQIVNFEPLTQNFTNLSFTSFFDLPKFTIVGAINEGFSKIGGWTGVAQVAVLFAPVAFVICGAYRRPQEPIFRYWKGPHQRSWPRQDPLGDGVGSMVGAVFGGCPNTIYGECVGCIAITGDASV